VNIARVVYYAILSLSVSLSVLPVFSRDESFPPWYAAVYVALTTPLLPLVYVTGWAEGVGDYRKHIGV
jgi:hypothetical protein